MKTRLSTIFTLILLLASAIPANAANETIEKTYCTQGIAYDSIDDLKLDLLNNAKTAVINELFGEFIVASTAVENFVVTKDQIQTSSIGFVRVEGNTDFHNGDDFADVCVTINAYITDEDKAKFDPEKIEKKYCDADENLTTAQLISYVKDEAIIQALAEYSPKLKGADRESLLQLVQKVTYRGNGFITDTQTYCANFEGYVVPVEIMALLETVPLDVTTPNPISPKSASATSETELITVPPYPACLLIGEWEDNTYNSRIWIQWNEANQMFEGRLTQLGNLKTYGFSMNELGYKAKLTIDPNIVAEEGKYRSTASSSEWRSYKNNISYWANEDEAIFFNGTSKAIRVSQPPSSDCRPPS